MAGRLRRGWWPTRVDDLQAIDDAREGPVIDVIATVCPIGPEQRLLRGRR